MIVTDKLIGIFNFSTMLQSYLIAFHIIGVVCWFAGLFYIVRLYIYDVEASLKEEPAKSILTSQFRFQNTF